MEYLPQGYILKNGVKPLHGFKYDHPLDGHGFINRIKVSPRGFEYKGIRQKTYHYKKEKDAQRILFRGLGTNADNNLFLNNFSNVALLKYEDDKVLSLGEGGIPYVIDVDTCETEGSMKIGNFPQCIIERLPYIPLSPHPTEHNGDIYNLSCFNYGFNIMINNAIVHTEMFPIGTSFYFHDFKITENWFVIFLNSVDLDFYGAYFTDKTIFESINFNDGNTILLIDKFTFKAKYIKLKPEHDMCTLHIAHVFEHYREKIDIYASLSEKLQLASVKTPYDFHGCFLHKITVNLHTVTEDYTCHKLTEIDGEMPIVVNNRIFLINKHTLFYYDIVKNDVRSMHIDDAILEEPCVCDEILYLIGHMTNKTKIMCINVVTFELIYEHVFDFNIPYGYHGLFLQRDFSSE
jgi:carotenoid cleavage dioxygenase-like enzyme